MQLTSKMAIFVKFFKPLPIQRKSILLKPLGVRNLFSQNALGMDNFLQMRKKTVAQLNNVVEEYKEKLNGFSSLEDSKNMVFTQDIKNMLHIAENDSDIELVIKMLRKFNTQNKSLRFGNYIFGPVIMRMFHHLNKPDEAFQCFKDPDLGDLLDQFKSYQILLDLLYENQRYDEVLEAFNIIQDKQIEGTKFSKDAVILTMAACYKMNSPESYEAGMKIWSNLMEVGHRPLRKAIAFCAALAVNQNHPQVAIEILSSARDVSYITIRNIKALALIKDNKIDETMQLLKSATQDDRFKVDKVAMLTTDVYETIKAAVEKQATTETKVEFKTLDTYLVSEGHISDLTLDQHLCEEIEAPVAFEKKTSNQFDWKSVRYQQNQKHTNRSAYNRTAYNRPAYNRPGLFDMVD